MTKSPSFLKRAGNFLKQLRGNQSGLALTEFALSIPIFTGLGMYGTETAYRAVAQMQVSQAALSLADNASRLGQTGDGSLSPTIQESDILEVLTGTRLQTTNLDLLENGRVILSSLEYKTIEDDDDRPQQFIRWQRCKGMRNFTSAYVDGINTEDEDFTGVGENGNIQAAENSAVMYVEIQYAYQPLFGDMFMDGVVINQDAAFNIRDDRDLDNGLNNDVGANRALCNVFNAT